MQMCISISQQSTYLIIVPAGHKGILLGLDEGNALGASDGCDDGWPLGSIVGTFVGCEVGSIVG